MNINSYTEHIPDPVYDRRPEFIALYNNAWKIAADHIRHRSGLPAERYMDEGFDPEKLWIWDTCFMVLYCKYSPDFFPGIQSLDNFYLPIHDNVSSPCLIQHPDNPPLFPWVEYEYFRFTANRERVYRILVEKSYLQRHYYFIENIKIGQRYPFSFALNMLQKNEYGYLWSGTSSGMDNTPRGNNSHSGIYWVDAIAQQALSALYIAKLADIIGENETSLEFHAQYEEKKEIINKYYFDTEDGCYYDIHTSRPAHCKVLTPASFWPLLADVASEYQAEKQVGTLLDQNLLGGDMPIPSVARNSRYFDPQGGYWRGGVWLPVCYMVTKAIERYGFFNIAADLSERIVARMSDVYDNYSPKTIWEAYAPSVSTPSSTEIPEEICRPDFCGWSALGPISMLIENILGFYSVDAVNNIVEYHYRDIGRHGIRKLKFGSVVCDIIVDAPVVKVNSNQPFCLKVDGIPYDCFSGETQVILPELKELEAVSGVI